MESQNLNEPTWIMNPKGVKSCWPRSIAEDRVNHNVGWKFCDPEYVPETKEFPMSSQMTEAGKARRNGINESRLDKGVAVETNLSEKEIRDKAKSLGIKHAHIKGIAKLAEEIKTLESN